MPELPEVETIKEALRKSISDATIEKVEIKNRRFREEIPSDFEKIVSNTRIVNIWRLAKYAIIDLDNGYSIIWHFGMSGKIKFFNDETTDFGKHDHVFFYTSIGILIYNDIRRFGLLSIEKTKDIYKNHLFSNIGLDPFDEKLNSSYLSEKLKNKKTPIKVLLLDQSIINGIGNIYASEALYLARISPFREANSLSLKELDELIEAVRLTLNDAIKAGGSTLRDYRKPDGSTGYFQNKHCVYNKTGQRCPNCRCDLNQTNGIQKTTQAGRSTFFCSTLQK